MTFCSRLPTRVKRADGTIGGPLSQTVGSGQNDRVYDEIEDFGARVQTLGTEHEIGPLQKFGKDLKHQAAEFEIEAVSRSLDAFPGLIEQLKSLQVVE